MVQRQKQPILISDPCLASFSAQMVVLDLLEDVFVVTKAAVVAVLRWIAAARGTHLDLVKTIESFAAAKIHL